ncbi:MAG: FG-GAP-like repeat-containing protein [Thermonemataceae bacterium]|nr:FG-GAP-like repeat-containing protein [Thermonemataceae bacterium]
MKKTYIVFISLLSFLIFEAKHLSAQLTFATGINNGVSGFNGTRYMVKTADFNGDGVADVVTTNGNLNGQIAVVLLDKDAQTISAVVYPAAPLSAEIKAVDVADYDKDGDVDIVALNATAGGDSEGYIFFKNNGNGTFTETTAFDNLGYEGGYSQIISYDYDKDGDLDIITYAVDGSNDHFLVYYAYDAGSFAMSPTATGLLAGPPISYDDTHHLELSIMDNATGEPDILLSNLNSSYVYRISNVGNPVSLSLSTIVSATGFRVTAFSVGDVNADGNNDIIVSAWDNSNSIDDEVQIWFGDGAGGATFDSNIIVDGFPFESVLYDLDNDNDLDLVVSRRDLVGTNTTPVWRNNGAGVFAINDELDLNNPTDIAVADFNLDAKPDLVVTRNGGDDTQVFLNQTPSLFPVNDTHIQTNNDGGFLRYIAGALLPKTSNFTVEGWIKVDDADFADNQYIFYNGSVGSDGFGLFIKASAGGLLIIDAGGTPISTGLLVQTKVWHHFALVNDLAGKWTLYLDGVSSGVVGTSTLAPPTSQTIICKDADNASDANSIRTASIQEFRFWSIALDAKNIRKWMHIQLNASHPQILSLQSYIPMDRQNGSDAFDVAFLFNKIMPVRKIDIVPLSSISFPYNGAPIGDNGSSTIVSASADINARSTVGVEIDFDNSQPLPGGELLISRVYDEQPFGFYPTSPSYVYSKVFWVFKNYGGASTFSDLDELILDIKDDEFISGLYPILNTPSNPNPAASAFHIFTRPANSTDAAEWVDEGFGSGFGSLRARRPGTSVGEFGRTMTVGVMPSVLPVRLVSFTAERVKEGLNLLKWQTAFEFNNEVFEIEKSYNAKDFFKIGFVAGKKNTQEVSNYSFEDKNASSSAYYRLKQKDTDGKISYTASVYVAVEGKENAIFSVYPNPVTDKIQLQIADSFADTPLDLHIYNVLGDKLWATSGKDAKDIENNLQNNLKNLPKGVYFAKLYTQNQVFTNKFIKQ